MAIFPSAWMPLHVVIQFVVFDRVWVVLRLLRKVLCYCSIKQEPRDVVAQQTGSFLVVLAKGSSGGLHVDEVQDCRTKQLMGVGLKGSLSRTRVCRCARFHNTDC